MKNLLKTISAVALAAGAFALPGAANAAASTATGTAQLAVVSQCAITGANVNFGSYLTTQTWDDVAVALGYWSGSAFTAGAQGYEYINWGSVTCDAGVNYVVQIKGPAVYGGIPLTVNGKVGVFLPRLKKIGSNTVPDSSALVPNVGGNPNVGVAGTGNGAAQSLIGNAIFSYSSGNGTTAVPSDKLTTAGAYSNGVSYTLTF